MRQLFKLILILSVFALFSAPAFGQAATPAATEGGNTIGLGDTVTGTLTVSQPRQLYTLQAEAGQAVNIHLTSDDFDAYLILQDASGNSLIENDDADGTNSAITGFVLPSGTSYTIVAESYGEYEGTGAETGDFTLTVSEQHIQHIEYSQTIQDRLTTDDPVKDYVFTGQAGDVIVAAENSSDFDSYLYLLDSSGNQLTYNDDSGSGTLNSLLGPFTLPNTGSYTLRATSIDQTTPGAFSLTLNKIVVTAVEYNQPTQVTFAASDQAKYFTFDGSSGDVVTITADSGGGSIDTSLTLDDPNESQVASDDNGGPGLDPEIYQQLLTSTGTYSVTLQAVTPAAATVTLLIKRSTPPSLDQSAQTVSLSETQNERAVTFNATSGEAVHLSLHLVNGQTGSPSVTIMQDDQAIASASGTSVSDLTLGFTPPADGQVIVEISDDSYNNVSYQVTLTPADQ